MCFIVIIYACTQCSQPYLFPITPSSSSTPAHLLSSPLVPSTFLSSSPFFSYIHTYFYSIMNNMLRTEYGMPIVANIITIAIMIIAYLC